MFVWDDGELNAEQEAAITEEKSVFLVACPGSGKTRTLTYKIARELSKLTSDKQWVIAITYTHIAADEIHERIENLGVDTSQLWIGTIHAFCLEWIIRPYAIYHDALKSGFTIINSHDTEAHLTRLCGAYRQAKITFWDCNNHYFTSGGIELTCHSAKKAHVRRILDQYHAEMLSDRRIDFELILAFAHELIVKQPSISKLLGSLFAYVLVDEYQDTKEIQYAILAAILKASDGKARAFIVGDPNQCIFGSLGGYAMPASAFAAQSGVDFREKELSRNYRSSDRIIGYFSNYNVFPTKIASASKHKDHVGLISLNSVVPREQLEAELVRLIRYNVETLGINPDEICIIAPWWAHLGSMTRRLVAALPAYSFDGPGMVPFSRDPDNFWYKLSKLVLTRASPEMFVRRSRWARDVLLALDHAGLDVSGLSGKALLRHCNSIEVTEEDGLTYLDLFFENLFERLGIAFADNKTLREHHEAFFNSSRERVERLKKDGTPFIGNIAAFRQVFQNRSGIRVSTIHGAKGAEYDVVIAYALLEGIVPHFSDPDAENAAKKLLYVLGSRARKNLHLISERQRMRGGSFGEYPMTTLLADLQFDYDIIS